MPNLEDLGDRGCALAFGDPVSRMMKASQGHCWGARVRVSSLLGQAVPSNRENRWTELSFEAGTRANQLLVAQEPIPARCR